MKYTKQALSITEQIERLEYRGLQFNNKKKAAHYLSNISYYRLRAYTYSYQDNTDENHPFIKPVSFEEIIDLYVFDRRLRILIFNAIEKIEIALRTKIVYEYAVVHGSHWFENKELFHNAHFFIKNNNKLFEEVERSDETFIKHYNQKYKNPKYPPAWMSLEVASMGLLSKIFANLKNSPLKNKVCNEFGLKKSKYLTSWMHSFVALRNICAHHSRVWNRRFTAKPLIPYNTLNPFIKNQNIHANKLYAQLCCINYISSIISPESSFKHDLKQLLSSCNLVDTKEMGFPYNWEEEQIWK